MMRQKKEEVPKSSRDAFFHEVCMAAKKACGCFMTAAGKYVSLKRLPLFYR